MITIPWIMHTDGNILPFLQDILSLGIAGLHPIEKGAMDIRQVKKEYGDKICLLGNVDLNILGMGTIEDVDAEVKVPYTKYRARRRIHRKQWKQFDGLSYSGKC